MRSVSPKALEGLAEPPTVSNLSSLSGVSGLSSLSSLSDGKERSRSGDLAGGSNSGVEAKLDAGQREPGGAEVKTRTRSSSGMRASSRSGLKRKRDASTSPRPGLARDLIFRKIEEKLQVEWKKNQELKRRGLFHRFRENDEDPFVSLELPLNLSNTHGVRFSHFRFVGYSFLPKTPEPKNSLPPQTDNPTTADPALNTLPPNSGVTGVQNVIRAVVNAAVAAVTGVETVEGSEEAEAKVKLVDPWQERKWRFKIVASESACEGVGDCIHYPTGGAEGQDEANDPFETNSHRKRKMHQRLSFSTGFHFTIAEAFTECFHIMKHIFRCLQCDVAVNMHDGALWLPKTSEPSTTPADSRTHPPATSPASQITQTVATAAQMEEMDQVEEVVFGGYEERKGYKAPRMSRLSFEVVNQQLCLRCGIIDQMREDLLNDRWLPLVEKTHTDCNPSTATTRAEKLYFPATFKCFACLQSHCVANKQQMFCAGRAKHKEFMCVFCFAKMQTRECPLCREITSYPEPEPGSEEDEDEDEDLFQTAGEAELLFLQEQQAQHHPPTSI